MNEPKPAGNKRIFQTVCDCTREIIVPLGKGNYQDSHKERWVRCDSCMSINRATEIDK